MTVTELLRRLVEIIAGFSLLGYGAVSALADAHELDRLEVLKRLEDQLDLDDD